MLATLGVTALLLIVAFADLKGIPNAEELPQPNDDAAAIGTGISSAIPSQTAGAQGANRARKRR